MQEGIDPRALFHLSYGLYVVASKVEEGCVSGCNGQIANAVMQITADPMCLAVCLHKDNLTTECISSTGVFSVAVLEEEVPMTFIGTFGFKCGRELDKFQGVNFKTGITGAPLILDHTVAVIEAEVVKTMDVFTHVLFVGRIMAAEVIKEGVPLTYANYHLIKKGKSPRNAPTFVLNQVK